MDDLNKNEEIRWCQKRKGEIIMPQHLYRVAGKTCYWCEQAPFP